MISPIFALAVSERTLANAGSIASIVTAAIAVVWVYWSGVRWLRARELALDIDHGLHVVNATTHHHSETRSTGETISVRIGLELRNGLARPLSFTPALFTSHALGTDRLLGESVSATDIAPGQQLSWYSDAMDINPADLPVAVRVDFCIDYGQLHRPSRRRLSGHYELSLSRSSAANALGETTVLLVDAEPLDPCTDEPITAETTPPTRAV